MDTGAALLSAESGKPLQQGRGGGSGWWILFESEIHFGKDILVPDLGS